METTSFKELLRAGVDLAGLNVDELSAGEYANWRGWLSVGLSSAWKTENWPDFRRIEPRYYRSLYENTKAYEMGAQVYHPASKKYFEALRGTTGHQPPDLGYWGECRNGWDCDPYDPAKAYAVGDLVYFAEDDRVYQCHTAALARSRRATRAVALPAPPDPLVWGERSVFVPYVPFLQEGQTGMGLVFGVWDGDPDTSTQASEVAYTIMSEGVLVLAGLHKVWIEFQTRPPSLRGAPLDLGSNYQPGVQVFFADELYDCAEATVMGQTPATSPEKWSKVEIPKFLADAVALSAYRRWLVGEGQQEKARALNVEYVALLGEQADHLFRSQNQIRRTRVLSR